MLRRLELSEDDHRALIERCIERRLLFMSTPFDEQSANLLAELDIAVFKIPSGEITNLSMLFWAHVGVVINSTARVTHRISLARFVMCSSLVEST